MKVCQKCGARNDDKRKICADCGQTLGERLTEAQEKEYRQGISDKIERLYNKKDPLFVGLLDKTVGIISIVGAVVTVVLIIRNLVIGETSEMLLYGLLFFTLSFAKAFFPKFFWAGEKQHLSWYINGAEDVQPGTFYFAGRKIFIILSAVLGVAALGTSFFVR